MNCICVISQNVPAYMIHKLERHFDVVKLPPDTSIAPPVSSHPDMLLSLIGSRLIFPKSYYSDYPSVIDKIISECGFDPIPSDAVRSAEYPFDVSLNATVVDNFVICRESSSAHELLSAARELGYPIVNVRQGYAGCSCIVAGDVLITSDNGIATASEKLGIESLYVSNKGISLPEYDVGFIGGCGGFYNGTLYFLGNIDSVECSDTIRKFASEKGITIVCLSDSQLTDYGGIKFFTKK